MFEPDDIAGSINETKDYGVLIDIDEDENAVIGFSASSAERRNRRIYPGSFIWKSVRRF